MNNIININSRMPKCINNNPLKEGSEIIQKNKQNGNDEIKKLKNMLNNIEQIKELSSSILNEEKRKMIFHTAEYLRKLIAELE